jgi:hypothetical protein
MSGAGCQRRFLTAGGEGVSHRSGPDQRRQKRACALALPGITSLTEGPHRMILSR